MSSQFCFCYAFTVKVIRWLLIVLGILVLLGGIAVAGVWYMLSPTDVKTQTLEITPNMGIASIAKQLERMGLIRNPQLFRAALQYVGSDRNIREGYYDLSGKLGTLEIAKRLGQPGRPRQVAVAIPEGWRLTDIVTRVSELGFASNAELETAFRQTNLLEYTRGAKSLEGFLFPATYQFRPEDNAKTIVQTLTQRFAEEITPARLTALKKLNLSVYQWVVLASMVQVEAGNTAEMPTIAGVFLNRLEIRMPLQSDPTIAYGLGKRLPELNRRAGDFESDTLFNTYKRYGLPPTPIANPGTAALEAIVKADRTNGAGKQWLYFLHGSKGEFKPNTNFAAHQRDNATFR